MDRLKLAIYTLGCKANQADSDALAIKYSAEGYEIVSSKELADIYVINTCTVTAKASAQSRQAVRKFMRKNPKAKIIVTGCDAKIEAEVFEGIIGLNGAIDRHHQSTCHPREGGDLPNSMSFGDSRLRGNDNATNRARPFIKIQDGCEQFCSYCIVPYVRGKYKSEQPDSIIKRVAELSKDNFEIVLTGIHIGKYGVDLKTNLRALVERILNETKIGRLRLSSLEPDELMPNIITMIAGSSGRIAPHLHIPLQGGADRILKLMNRAYTTDDYRRLVAKIKNEIPNVSIGADVITGFPGETEGDFNETYEFIKSLPITYLHVFTYSDRKGTKASEMQGKISEPVKRERTAKLRELSTLKRTGFLKENLGVTHTVVFDKKKHQGKWKGVTGNYITVIVDKLDPSTNVHKVKLEMLADEQMIGKEVK